MKLNLLLSNPDDLRSGFINVDPGAEWNDLKRVNCKLDNLSPIVDANEVTELVALDVLDHYPTDKVDAVLDHWLSRLAHGGKITISVVDIREVARIFLNGAMDIAELNNLVHNNRQCSITLSQLVEVLENKGLTILTKRVVDRRAVITGVRP